MTAQDPETSIIPGEGQTSSSSSGTESTASEEHTSQPHGENGGAMQVENHQDGVQNGRVAEGSLPIDHHNLPNERQEHGATTSGLEDTEAYDGRPSQLPRNHYTALAKQENARDWTAADGDDKLFGVNKTIAALSHEVQELKAHNIRLLEELQKEQAEQLSKTKRCQYLEQEVENLIQERNAAAAQRLTINTFDSSLDKVSEGHLVGEVEALNNSIADLVSNVIDGAASAPSGWLTEEGMDFARSEPLLEMAVRTETSDDNRELLVEAALHRFIIHNLYPVIFEPQVAPSIPGADVFENLYSQVISKNEPWKISQRWLSVTANAINECISSDQWRPLLERFARDLVEVVSIGLKRSLEHLQHLNPIILAGLLSIWQEAARLSISMRRDCISVQLFASIKYMRAPLDDTIEVKWESKHMPRKSIDHVLGTYALGVQKMESTRTKTTLLRSKVVTDALLRYASSSS